MRILREKLTDKQRDKLEGILSRLHMIDITDATIDDLMEIADNIHDIEQIIYFTPRKTRKKGKKS